MLYLAGINMDDVDRLACRSHEIHEKGPAAFQHFYNDSDVSGVQVMAWQVNKQGHSFGQGDHRLRLSFL